MIQFLLGNLDLLATIFLMIDEQIVQDTFAYLIPFRFTFTNLPSC
jgi:hypothetical protein